MKKKIKDLTLKERQDVCNKHVYDYCDKCPFSIPNESNYCLHTILNVLEREVDVEDKG